MTAGGGRAVVPLMAFVLAICAGLAMSACRRAQPLCAFCQMAIPPETAATVVVNGETQQVCDPRCALTHQKQTGRPAALATVSDFETGTPLAPERAFFLTGSDVTPDVSQEPPRRPEDPAYREWHRCLPSVLAFGTRDAATRFQRRHGGTVQTLSELGYAADVSPSPTGVRPRS